MLMDKDLRFLLELQIYVWLSAVVPPAMMIMAQPLKL